jgi:hypothetical protein
MIDYYARDLSVIPLFHRELNQQMYKREVTQFAKILGDIYANQSDVMLSLQMTLRTSY